MSNPASPSPVTNDNDPMIGGIIAGKYEIEARVGAGSMGVVYRARHLTLEKVVCIKTMRDSSDPSLAERFQREARAASRLDHPCSVHVLDYGREVDGMLYIAMEFVDGRDLFSLMQEAQFTPERTALVMTQMLSALSAAHDVGVLHRDLKPENILVSTVRADDGGLEERVKVCDFGVAHIVERDISKGRRLTGEGLIIGTPHYMSPEQARAEAVDERSDVYSAGVVMFQLLTGQLPFDADTAVNVALKQITEEPPRPSDIRPGTHPVLEAICLRALRKEPSERWASAREMRSAIREVLSPAREPQRSAPTFESERPTLTETPAVEIDVRPRLLAQLVPPPRRPSRAGRLIMATAFLGLLTFGVVRRHDVGAVIEIATATAAPSERAAPSAKDAIVDAAVAEPAPVIEAAPVIEIDPPAPAKAVAAAIPVPAAVQRVVASPPKPAPKAAPPKALSVPEPEPSHLEPAPAEPESPREIDD
jgi:serine/threonine protein kinase